MIAIDFGALSGSAWPLFLRRTVDAAPIVLMRLVVERRINTAQQ